jgi:hypothetical protein
VTFFFLPLSSFLSSPSSSFSSSSSFCIICTGFLVPVVSYVTLPSQMFYFFFIFSFLTTVILEPAISNKRRACARPCLTGFTSTSTQPHNHTLLHSYDNSCWHEQQTLSLTKLSLPRRRTHTHLYLYLGKEHADTYIGSFGSVLIVCSRHLQLARDCSGFFAFGF